VASVHGVQVTDIERRRTLLLGILVGESGASFIRKAAERTGQHWGKAFVRSVPATKISALNKVLGRWFVTKYGTKQGILVLGRIAPFGIGMAIGAAGNAAFGRTVIAGARSAFGSPPERFPDGLPPDDA